MALLRLYAAASEHDIYRVSEKTLVEVPSQTIVALAVPDHWFYSRPLPEQLVLPGLHVLRIRLLRYAWDHHRSPSALFLASVPPISCQDFDTPVVQPSDLLHRLVNSMPVIFVPKGESTDDKAIPQSDYRDLVAEFVLLMLLAFTDAEHIRLMK